MSDRREKLILGTAIALFVGLSTLVGWFKYHASLYNVFDLGIYTQVFWNTAHGHWFASTIHAPSYLGDHAEWFILPLSLLYRLVPHALTLVFFQAVTLGLCAWPIFLIVKKSITTFPQRVALLFGGLWLLNPFVWNIALFEFHMLPFAILPILFAVYYFREKRIVPFLLFVFGALLVREDVALAILGFVVLALLDKERRKDWRWTVIPFLLSTTVFVFDQKVVAHFNPDSAYKFLIYYQWLGNSIPDVLKQAVLHPLIVLGHIANFQNFVTIVFALIPLFVLPLVRPRYLLLSALPFAQLLMTPSGASDIVLMTHYSSLLLPGLFIAAIEGFEAVQSQKEKIKFYSIVPLITGLTTLYAFFIMGPGIEIFKIGHAVTDARRAALLRAVALIPNEASVLSPLATLPQLGNRAAVYSSHYAWLGKKQFGSSDYTLPEQPEYLVVDESELTYYAIHYPNGEEWMPEQTKTGDNRFRDLIEAGHYAPIMENDGVSVYKKNTALTPPAYSLTSIPTTAHSASKALGAITLVGWVHDTHHWRLYLKRSGVVPDEYLLKINGAYLVPGTGLYPPAEWPTGAIIPMSVDSDAQTILITPVTVHGNFVLNTTGSNDLMLKDETTWESVSLP